MAKSKFISYAPTISKSVHWKKLLEETELIPYSALDTINWAQIRELHILGNAESENSRLTIFDSEIPVERHGCYISSDHTWLFILGIPVDKIATYTLCCSQELKTLDIRFTAIKGIDISSVTGVNQLCLSNNPELESVTGLECLGNLSVLDLKKTVLSLDLDLSDFPSLYSLSIRETQISKISIKAPLVSLHIFDAAKSKISNADFVSYFPSLQLLNLSYTTIESLPDIKLFFSLKVLNLSYTKVDRVPNISLLKKLRTLNIGYTNIVSLDSVIFPSGLRGLSLSGTAIKQLPNSIKNLTSLCRLGLADMLLDSLPTWLLDLELEFVTDDRYGINLRNTIISNVDMSIFSQPRVVIEAWFKSMENIDQPLETLDEAKVIFLGDGGVGKSLTVQRLLAEGDFPENFDGDATPGISITSKKYNINEKTVLVHFWDFGGQEILHSMHRMFLTKRTLYVVLVNARDNTQDERARYWLHNIKSFADNSPILLVLNQIDQNMSASVNEIALRELYPQMGEIVKLSAKNYSPQEFVDIFENTLLNEIFRMPSINEPFLPSWNLLKTKLQHMSKNYINANEYILLSEECGVEKSENVRSSLLDWFSDLGVSFCYRDSSALSNYMVLRPDWITNAIYIILFNSAGKVKNGLIKHETIHQMLHPAGSNYVQPKSVLQDVVYTVEETEYVLGVIRKFRLSYRLDDETEFIPMLCERNEKPIAALFSNSERILEFHMLYTYLPNNVIHRLMVEMRSHLDIDNVWLSGAIFAQDDIGLSALVKIEDNTLKIYVKSENTLHPANTYLNIIKTTIERINKSLGLHTTGNMVYRKDGKVESFDYEYLIDSYEHGNKQIYSRVFKKNLKILDILDQTDRIVTEKRLQLLEDIIHACQGMQNSKIYWHASEDERNTYVRDLLRAHGYYIADQTRNGKSASGKQSGELDIEIRESAEKPWTIYEALNITSFSEANKAKWNEHLVRLLDNYNPIGCPFLFLVSYLECAKDKFKEVWLTYWEHLSRYSPDNYSLQNIDGHSDDSFYIRSAECVYDRAGLPTTVYQICVRLGD